MKKKKEEFDYEGFEKEAVKKLRSGKGLTGQGGALTGLIGRILRARSQGIRGGKRCQEPR